MRLPAINERQAANEASREMNELVYQAFLEQRKYHIATDSPGVVQMRVNYNHRFWTHRKFRIRTERVAGGLDVWLERR